MPATAEPSRPRVLGPVGRLARGLPPLPVRGAADLAGQAPPPTPRALHAAGQMARDASAEARQYLLASARSAAARPDPWGAVPAALGLVPQSPLWTADQVWSDPWAQPYRGPLDLDNFGSETPAMRWLYRVLYRTEPAVSAAIDGKAEAIACLNLSVRAADKRDATDGEAAEFFGWAVENSQTGTHGVIRDILLPGLIDGFSLSEVTLRGCREKRWGYEPRHTLRHVRSLNTAWLRLQLDPFRNVTGVVNLVRGLQDYDPAKVVLFTHKPLFANPFGGSDLRPCVRACWLIDEAYRLWHLCVQVYGAPFLLGKYSAPERRKMMEAALAQARARGYMVIPVEDEAQVLNFATATSFDVFEKLVERQRQEVYLAVRGAFLPFLEGTSGGSGDRAGDSGVQKLVGSDPKEEFLAKEVGHVLTRQLAPAVVRPNYGDRAGTPRCLLGGTNWGEVKQQMDVVGMIVDKGGEVSAEYVHEFTTVPPPRGPHDVWGKKPPPTQPPAGPGGGPGGPPGGGPGPQEPPPDPAHPGKHLEEVFDRNGHRIHGYTSNATGADADAPPDGATAPAGPAPASEREAAGPVNPEPSAQPPRPPAADAPPDNAAAVNLLAAALRAKADGDDDVAERAMDLAGDPDGAAELVADLAEGTYGLSRTAGVARPRPADPEAVAQVRELFAAVTKALAAGGDDATRTYSGPPRPGLVAQTGDPDHPGHWVRPDEVEADDRAALHAHDGGADPGTLATVKAAAGRVREAVYGWMVRATPAAWELLQALTDTPADWGKYGFEPTLAGAAHATHDPVRQHTGIGTHLAISVVSKVLARALVWARRRAATRTYAAVFAGVRLYAWVADPTPRSKSRATNTDTGLHAYGETARRLLAAQGRADRGEPEPEHPARARARQYKEEREPARQEARQRWAAAVAEPGKLSLAHVEDLRDHLHALTRDEARAMLRELGRRTGGLVKEQIVEGLLSHLRASSVNAKADARAGTSVESRETIPQPVVTDDRDAERFDAARDKLERMRKWQGDRPGSIPADEAARAAERRLDAAKVAPATPPAQTPATPPPVSGDTAAPEPAALPAPAAAARTRPPAPGTVRTVHPSQLSVDPARFQFKLNTAGPAGVTDELKGVRTWNPEFAGVLAVWHDPDDGRDYVVNGHHRHELATRLGADSLAVRYIDAADAKTARAKGALINIAEGRGTAVDAAKFMRDMGVSLNDFEKYGVPLKSGQLADQAATLTRLNDHAFDRLTRGDLDLTKALAVAKHLDDPQRQEKLFKLLEKREDEGKDLSARTVEEMARAMAAAPTVTRTEATLWGPEETTEDVFVQRAELAGHVRTELAKELGDFAAVASQRRAGRVAGAGNTLNVERNKELATEAEQAKNLYDQLVNRKGPISDALNAAAVTLASAKTKKERERARADATEAVRAAIRGEFDALTRKPEPAAEADRGGEGQAVRGDQGVPDRQPAAEAADQPGRGGAGPGGLTPEPHVPEPAPAAEPLAGADRQRPDPATADHAPDLEAIPNGQSAWVAGHNVRRVGRHRWQVESAKGYVTGDAAEVAGRIRDNWKLQAPEQGPAGKALARADAVGEPDWTDAAANDRDARGRAAVPAGARAVSLDPNTRGRVGSVVRDPETGQTRLRLDGGTETHAQDFEPLDSTHSWRSGDKPAPTPQSPPARTGDLLAGVGPGEPPAPASPQAPPKPADDVYTSNGLPFRGRGELAVDRLDASHLPAIERRVAELEESITSARRAEAQESDPFRAAEHGQRADDLEGLQEKLEDARGRLRRQEILDRRNRPTAPESETADEPDQPEPHTQPVGTARLGDGREVTFVPHESAKHGGRATVWVDPAKLDAAWRADDPGYHVPAGGGGAEVPGRRARFREFLSKGEPVRAPRAVISADGKVGFEDGRHRFSVLRDAGIDRVPVTVPAEQADEFARRYGAAPGGPAP